MNASAAQELFHRAPGRARALIGDVLRLAEAGLTEMRALILELRPESLETEGLLAAVEKQAAALQARHGVQVRLSLGNEPSLPLAMKEAVYRVAQEAMHTVAKHGRAQILDVELNTSDGVLQLVVADNGRGFDPSHEFPGHLGLKSMHERVAAIVGTLEIQSAPGAGTRVCLTLPLTTTTTGPKV